jgi:hypothetical protein
MAYRLAFVQALAFFTWTTVAGAQPAAVVASPAINADADPPVPHPLFGVASLSGELGGNYAAGVKVALLASPFSYPGLSLGGTAFFAPITDLQDTCSQPCKLNPLLFRGMAQLRLGNAYTEYATGLAWVGISAGVAYLTEPGLDPSPSAALSGGGDLRLSSSLWLELSLQVTWAQIIGSGSSFAGPYFNLGLDVGLRFDFMH